MKSITTLTKELYKALDRNGRPESFAVVYAPCTDQIRVLTPWGRVYENLMNNCEGKLAGIYDNECFYPQITRDLKVVIREFKNDRPN